MRFDHRRILATAIARLRAKLKYRPVVFELLPPEFTLTELQRTVEAISGRHLHKQNFRRLVEAGALVEPTGVMSTQTGGRPAALFRFRREVLQERPAPGLRRARPALTEDLRRMELTTFADQENLTQPRRRADRLEARCSIFSRW